MNATTFRPSGLPLRSAFLLLGIGIACLGALDLAIGRADPSDARFDALLSKAEGALVAERWDTAESLFRKARAARPQRADLVAWHAASLAQLGRRDEAFTVLTEAGRLGYCDVLRLRWEEAFGPLRAHPRFKEALATVEANQADLKKRAAASDTPQAATEAPAFATLSALVDAFDREEVRLIKENFIASEPERRALRMRKIAALERYVAEHPHAKDRGDATTESLRMWLDRTETSLPWPEHLVQDLVMRAAALAGDASASPEQRREARFYALLGRAFAGPESDDPRGTTPPTANGCRQTLDHTVTMASDPEGDAWSARAAALHAICLQVLHPEKRDAFRTSRAHWTAAALPRTSKSMPIRVLDSMLETLTVAAALKTFGPPPFELTSSEGKTVNLQSLRGKVVLLNFWSPG